MGVGRGPNLLAHTCFCQPPTTIFRDHLPPISPPINPTTRQSHLQLIPPHTSHQSHLPPIFEANLPPTLRDHLPPISPPSPINPTSLQSHLPLIPPHVNQTSHLILRPSSHQFERPSPINLTSHQSHLPSISPPINSTSHQSHLLYIFEVNLSPICMTNFPLPAPPNCGDYYYKISPVWVVKNESLATKAMNIRSNG